MIDKLKITILGSGTSSGVPVIGCKCETCLSDDPKDKRLRASVLVEYKDTKVVIDTSTDFRMQMLNSKTDKIDAVVYTHHHFDHIGGFDDLRALNYSTGKSVPIYIMNETLEHLKNVYAYAFRTNQYEQSSIPKISINIIDYNSFKIKDLFFQPIQLEHGNISVSAFRIGNFAYCTDTNGISKESMKMLENLDVLILGALRYKPHPTHFTIGEAIDVVKQLKPKQTYLTHLAHQIKHSECETELPKGIKLAYDGLVFEVPM